MGDALASGAGAAAPRRLPWHAKGRRWLKIVAVSYGGFLATVFMIRTKMIYHPAAAAEEAALLPAAQALGMEPWHDPRGGHWGWKRERPGAKGAALVLHGNAGTALHRVQYAYGLYRQGYSVYLLEYPGYAARPGRPSRSSVLAAGRDALERLSAAGPVVLVGESIGSGPACALAAEFPTKVAGVLLAMPFARLAEVGARMLPWVPVKLLIGGEDWDNRAALAKYHGPVAFLIAGQDEIVGADQGRSLRDGYAGPKWTFEQADAGHNDVDLDAGLPMWAEFAAFVAAGT